MSSSYKSLAIEALQVEYLEVQLMQQLGRRGPTIRRSGCPAHTKLGRRGPTIMRSGSPNSFNSLAAVALQLSLGIKIRRAAVALQLEVLGV